MIEQSLRLNPRNVPLLDTGLMILVIICGIMKNKKIIRSRDVVFNEKVMYKDQLQGKKVEKENTKYIVLDEIKENEVLKAPENQGQQQVPENLANVRKSTSK